MAAAGWGAAVGHGVPLLLEAGALAQAAGRLRAAAGEAEARRAAEAALGRQPVYALRARAKALGLTGVSALKKAGLVRALLAFGDRGPDESPETLLLRLQVEAGDDLAELRRRAADPGGAGAGAGAEATEFERATKWGLMAVLSGIPYFNWLAWVFAAVDADADEGKDRELYWGWGAAYGLGALAALADGGAGGPNWYAGAATLVCLLHVQAERLRSDAEAGAEPDVPAFLLPGGKAGPPQLFGEPAAPAADPAKLELELFDRKLAARERDKPR